MLNSAALRPTLGPALRTLGLALVIGLTLASRAALGDELQEANKLLKAGDYPQALARVDKILAARPSDPQAQFLKGVILTEQGDDKDALVVFRKLTRDYPELPEPYNNIAVIYASQGEYEKAREALEQSIQTHPSYATAYENLGDVYATLAGRAYDKALQIDSSNSIAQHKLALLRQLIGGPPGSIKEAHRVAVAAAANAPARPEPAPTAPVEPTAPALAQAKPEPKQPPTRVTEAIPSAPAPVAAKSAEPAAAPTPPARTASGASADRAALAAVQSWARAWSSRDVDAYLAHYAKNFETPKGQSRAAWEKERRERVKAPKWIKVSIGSPKVHLAKDGAVTVTFRQTYRSNFIHSTTMKTLVMEPSGGRWLIRQERVGR